MEQHKDGPAAAMLHRAQDTMAGMVGQAEAAAAARSIEGFLENAWASNLYVIGAGELALERSRSPAVREVAEMMIRDHSASQQQLQVELDRMIGNFAVPAALDGRRQGMLDHLAQASDTGFDSAYLSQQGMAHQEAITMFSAYAEHGEQQLVASYARANLPVLRQHAEHVAAVTAKR
jgi:putative membrane protein